MKVVKTALIALAVLFVMSSAAMAQPTGAAGAAGDVIYPFARLSGIAVGLVIIGAALGIGGLTRSAVESMARQPEIAANIQTAMIISAALIEGVTFFALIIIGFILVG
jgi:F-type H+-transporting ATPase subunit c